MDIAVSQWGSPAARKHAFLLHGLTASSHMWYNVAKELAADGYLVTAPDLVGHGQSGLGGPDYSVQALARTLEPFFSGGREFDVVIGHSLGSLIVLDLLAFLPTGKANAVILVDPPIMCSDEQIKRAGLHYVDQLQNSLTVEQYKLRYPHWKEPQGVLKAFSSLMCNPVVVGAMLEHNTPWSFAHKLSNLPSHVKITILGSDPEIDGLFRVEHLDLDTRRKIDIVMVTGASHGMPRDMPGVIVETVLREVEKCRM